MFNVVQMANSRVTDLAYGHLGKVTYDSEIQQWSFSRAGEKSSLTSNIHPIIGFTSSSFHSATESKAKIESRPMRMQLLAKEVPESAPVLPSLFAYMDRLQTRSEDNEPSTLLAFGKASDSTHRGWRQRDFGIFATVHGETGQLLKLIRPISENVEQETLRNSRVRLLNPTSAEEGYYFLEGGPIQQICFASDIEGPTSWLAVRNAQSTTIFKPMYHDVPVPQEVPESLKKHYAPSRLSTNLIISLSRGQTGGVPHADVAFNPWYVKQFVTIDLDGRWSIWNIEGQKRKRSTHHLLPGKSGHIYDDLASETVSNLPDHRGTWSRVLWVGGVSTLIVSGRRHLAIFDIKSRPKRLHLPEMFRLEKEPWILDIKRNPTKLDQVFVLTASRIIVLELNGDLDYSDSDDNPAVSMLFSYQHFRDGDRDLLKLEVVREPDACMALLYSTQNLVLNTYRLSIHKERNPVWTWSSDAGTLAKIPSWPEHGTKSVMTLCVIPAQLILNRAVLSSEPGPRNVKDNVRFYQTLCLASNLSLSHTLLTTTHRAISTIDYTAELQSVFASTVGRVNASRIRSSSHIVDDDFVVPGGLIEYEDPYESSASNNESTDRLISYHISSPPFDASRLYELAFPNHTEDKLHQDIVQVYVENIQHSIVMRKNDEDTGVVSCIELSGYSTFSEDVDEASVILRDMMSLLQSSQENGSVIISFSSTDLFHSVEDDQAKETIAVTSLSNVYDKLIDLWVSCLPRKAPASLRVSKEKTVRSIALELFLSALTVSIRSKETSAPLNAPSQEENALILPLRTKGSSSLSSGDPNLASEKQVRIVGSAYPTPARSPSTHSDGESISTERSAEDEAIARLRGYLRGAKSLRPLGSARATILAHWPTDSEADPSQYSWKGTKSQLELQEEFGSDEESLKRQRESERRRRRTERFLKRQKSDLREASSQSISAVRAGSQPLIPDQVASSQTVEAPVPMTQPDRGTHGSRVGQHVKKKKLRAFR